MTNTTHLKPLLLGSLLLLGSAATLGQDSTAGGYDAAEAEKSRARNESRGVISGMLIGGLVAGPPGAIFSAVAGGLIGNNISNEEEKEQLQASLSGTRRQLADLQAQKQALEVAMAELQESRLVQASYAPAGEGVLLCCADSELTLHFRTDSMVVEPHYQPRLREFARLAKQVPDAVIQVSGYADRRGDEGDNLSLSQRRILAVEQALKSLGLDNTIIQTAAHGENRPLSAQEEALEGHFFDRRVEIRIRSQNNDYLTLME